MKKKLLLIAGLSTLLLGGCAVEEKAAIIFLDDNMNEARRVDVDKYRNYSEDTTIYYINGEEYTIKNAPHILVTKEKNDDE